MGGGLLQLVATGEQNKYLNSKPQFSFFQKVYRHHTNFAIEHFPQVFTNPTDINSELTAVISRNGDLLSRIYLVLELDKDADLPNMKYNSILTIIDYISIEIGGQEIDRHTGEWLYLWFYLTYSSDQYSILRNCLLNPHNNPGRKVYIPLQFWFCRMSGMCLPLCALQYHKVKINLKFKKNLNNYTLSNNTGNPVLWCDYIFLASVERKFFAQKSHEYLIDQMQSMHKFIENKCGDTLQTRVDLLFDHPVKELIWIFQNKTDSTNIENYWSIHNEGEDQIESAALLINNDEVFKRQPAQYYRNVQVYKHHTYGGCNIEYYDGTVIPAIQTRGECIYVYSFALKPEQHQPSGSCNFSRIKSVSLDFTLKAVSNCTDFQNYRNMTVYALNYNILKIEGGVGGLIYEN